MFNKKIDIYLFVYLFILIYFNFLKILYFKYKNLNYFFGKVFILIVELIKEFFKLLSKKVTHPFT